MIYGAPSFCRALIAESENKIFILNMEDYHYGKKWKIFGKGRRLDIMIKLIAISTAVKKVIK